MGCCVKSAEPLCTEPIFFSLGQPVCDNFWSGVQFFWRNQHCLNENFLCQVAMADTVKRKEVLSGIGCIYTVDDIGVYSHL